MRDACLLILRRAGRGLLLLVAAAAAGEARAQTPPPQAGCTLRPFRWLEDCRNLAGAELTGLDRVRYAPLTNDGSTWLTLGGEARSRMDVLQDVDFGINGQPGYVAVSGRLLVHADLRTEAGPRLFTQVGIVQQDGRRPEARAQDESGVDFTQMFVDLPWRVGDATANLRIGRQEIDLSANRLVAPRDGSTLRRTFEGVKLDVLTGGARLSLLTVRPMDLRDEAFGDRSDPTERFTAVSLDVPRNLVGGAALNLYYFDRDRADARFLRAQGHERRYSVGAHYVHNLAGWRVDAQGAWQTGRSAGKPVRAYMLGVALDRELGGPRQAVLGLDFVATSGDRAKTRAIETFDPTYPNNGGLSDAPLFYQTNYVFAGGGVSARFGPAVWAVQSNLLLRHSTGDAVYANGRPIPAPFDDSRLTSLLSQVSVRRAWGQRYEVYASLVRADALQALRRVGGEDAYYSRVQVTARF